MRRYSLNETATLPLKVPERGRVACQRGNDLLRNVSRKQLRWLSPVAFRRKPAPSLRLLCCIGIYRSTSADITSLDLLWTPHSASYPGRRAKAHSERAAGVTLLALHSRAAALAPTCSTALDCARTVPQGQGRQSAASTFQRMICPVLLSQDRAST